jgi:osmotically-inducible protein OsmY
MRNEQNRDFQRNNQFGRQRQNGDRGYQGSFSGERFEDLDYAEDDINFRSRGGNNQSRDFQRSSSYDYGRWSGGRGDQDHGFGNREYNREHARDYNRDYGRDYGSGSMGMGTGSSGMSMNERSRYGSGQGAYGSQSPFGQGHGYGYGSELGGRGDWDSSSAQWSSGKHDQGRGEGAHGVWESVKETAKDFFGIGPKGYRRSDERIREDVSEALARDRFVDASQIEVDVKDGRVILRGSVMERQMKRRAEDCVEHLSGVQDVRNEIEVRKESDFSGDASSSRSFGSEAGGLEERNRTDKKKSA